VKDRTDEVDSVIVAFRCPPDLVDAIEQRAAFEGISKSDVARRACIRDIEAARDKLAHAFLESVYAAWLQHGDAVLAELARRKEDTPQ
jgi:hypothetical protein